MQKQAWLAVLLEYIWSPVASCHYLRLFPWSQASLVWIIAAASSLVSLFVQPLPNSLFSTMKAATKILLKPTQDLVIFQVASVSLTVKNRVLAGSTVCTSGLISLCAPLPASTTMVSSLLLLNTEQVLASGPLHSLFALSEHASSKTSFSHTLSQYQLLGQTSPDRHPTTSSKIYLPPFNPFALLYFSS